jgi:membrane-associated phospholipid phosphatase
MFAALTSFDLPYNQAPSLHIALLVVLWHFYRQVLPRRWHPALHAACLTIAISALTTWQHHFIDIPTGAWLGALCVFLLPDDARSPFAARLSPTSIPGHGGMLDRVDSLCLSAPVFFWLVRVAWA